jgi:hypothetical protein
MHRLQMKRCTTLVETRVDKVQVVVDSLSTRVSTVVDKMS